MICHFQQSLWRAQLLLVYLDVPDLLPIDRNRLGSDEHIDHAPPRVGAVVPCMNPGISFAPDQLV